MEKLKEKMTLDDLVIVKRNGDGSLGEIRGKYIPRKKKQHNRTHDYYLTIAGNLADTEIILTSISQAILLQMDFNNRIVIDNVIIKNLATKYKKKIGTFWSTINRMVNDRSLIRESTGHYFANPYFFTKASSERIGQLRFVWNEIALIKSNEKIEVVTSKLAQEKTLNAAKNILNGDDND